MSKVCAIGLDGGTFEIVDYLVGQGRLPNLRRLIGEGSRATLMSTRPPITPAAWASFYTGTNPGKHGVVDFFRRSPGTYDLTPVNGQAVNGRKLWSIASEHGKRVCAYNVPLTYPAVPVNGLMISGMDSPGPDERAFSSPECRRLIFERFPDFQIEPTINPLYLLNHFDDPEGELIELHEKQLQLQIDVIRYLMELEDWDLFMAVIRTPDSLQHAFWDSVDRVIADGAGRALVNDLRRAEAVFSCYEKIDRELGDIADRGGQDTDLVIMSDHGFGPLRREVALNRVLAEAGLLKFRKVGRGRRTKQQMITNVSSHLPESTRKRLSAVLQRYGKVKSVFLNTLNQDIDWEQTRLYSLGQFGCLFTNLVGREPQGTVRAGREREVMLLEAEAALASFEDPEDGNPVFTEFYHRDRLFRGTQTDDMPAMVVAMRNYSYRGICSLTSELSSESLVRRPHEDWGELAPTGCHRREGLLLMYGAGIRHADLGARNIMDVTPTILSLMGLPLEGQLDGEVLEEALLFSSVSEFLLEPVPDRTATGGHPWQPVYSVEEEQEIRDRLENLGYL